MRRVPPIGLRARPRYSRRALVAGAVRATVGLSLAAPGPSAARARGATATLLALSDLHAPYRRLPSLLAALRAAAAAAPGPVAILVNGDVFERGNVAALRSGGAPDWAFLSALAALGPLVVNIGNHETALIDDLAAVAARLRALGALPIGGPEDARTGRPFAPAVATLDLDGLRVAVLGLPAADPMVYRPAARALMRFPDPAAVAQAGIGPAMAGADALVVASHAGVAADRAILPLLPAHAFLLGGHDHLAFAEPGQGAARYAHLGYGGSAFGALTFAPGAAPSFAFVEVADDAPADPGLAALVAATLAEHLTPEDRAVVATLAAPLALPLAAALAAEAARLAAGADAALLNHTSFGAGLPRGPVSRYDFDAFLRFDDAICVGEMEGTALARVLARANQHDGVPLSARTGDYLHATRLAPEPGRIYRVAVNGWVAGKAAVYLGDEAVPFTALEGKRLRPETAAALAG
jgi:2',3'-cyclic-nucleotide 2'-phosphodiesterase (5'-nucleotidase family)